jgi:tetrahydromethanopterin S-methyltransferase subunit G
MRVLVGLGQRIDLLSRAVDRGEYRQATGATVPTSDVGVLIGIIGLLWRAAKSRAGT